MFKDYYSILCIGRNATIDEIKNGYRTECKKWHPDKNPNIDTTQKMQDIVEAYLVLKDEEAKQRYDVEYDNFYHTHQPEETASSKTKQGYEYSEYQFQDEILKKWMENAKKQAKNSVREVIDEFKGASTEAVNYTVYSFIKILLPMAVGLLLFKTCTKF